MDLDTAGARAAPAALTGVGAGQLASSSDRVVVVGAGGWLGLATLELLHGLLGDRFAERVVCFGSEARTLRLRGHISVEQGPLSALGDLPSHPSLVLNCAFLTQEKAKVMPEADYVAANRGISAQVLGALDRIGARGVFVPSSGAVYGVDRADAAPSMRLYGALKLEDERAFASWSHARGTRAVIARVFNLSGPYINKQSSYALACFIADALAGRPIRIRATHPVYRSYVAIRELMSVVFAALTDGHADVTRFDTAGPDVYELSRVAEIVADVLGADAGIDRPAPIAGEADRYIGDARDYEQLMATFNVQPVPFPVQVGETAAYMAGAPSGGAST